MNDASNKIRQQIVDKIKSTTNILVAVSRDPSVDELSAALGLAALLNKLGKHATAIFSGTIPPAITFLEPDKVFESSADSLRDFIIALDKEKADHLRYKIEGDVVKIFITPYRTTITSDDLEFSQGDFNVELVLALGVTNQDNLDTALSAHNQIMSDVTIATFSAGSQASQLGSLDWRDETASSQCEMVAILSDDLKVDKSLLDKQVATALLTGIVSATDRFSNPLTTARVMTIAANLMAAGADQQLIAAKLQESHEVDSLPVRAQDKIAKDDAPIPTDGFVIPHGGEEVVAEQPVEEPKITEPSIPIAQPTPETEPEPTPTQEVAPEPAPEPPKEETEPPQITEVKADSDTPKASKAKVEIADEPLLGGILNATTDQAAEDARRELEEQQNKTMLSHSYITGTDSSTVAPINSASVVEDEEKPIDIFAESPNTSTLPPSESSFPLPPPPPVPDFSEMTEVSTVPPATQVIAPEAPAEDKPVDISNPLSTLPPIPEPPVPGESTDTTPPTENAQDDPTKFKIPGQ